MTNKTVKALIDNALKVGEDKPKMECDCCGDAANALDINKLCFQCAITNYAADHLVEKHEICPICAFETGHEIMEIICNLVIELAAEKGLEALLEDIKNGMVSSEEDQNE